MIVGLDGVLEYGGLLPVMSPQPYSPSNNS